MKRVTIAAYFFPFLLILICRSAHADSITTFQLDNLTMRGGGTATGTVTIDITTGIVLDENISASQGGVFHTFTGITHQASNVNDTGWNSVDAAGDIFQLAVPPEPQGLVGFTGGLLCSDSNHCQDQSNPLIEREGGFLVGGDTNLDYFDSSGSLDPVPEPSSLLLLGTGLLACGCLLCYREREIFLN